MKNGEAGLGRGGFAAASNSILFKSIDDPSCRLRERSERMETSHHSTAKKDFAHFFVFTKKCTTFAQFYTK
jgi:hypothetical protein